MKTTTRPASPTRFLRASLLITLAGLGTLTVIAQPRPSHSQPPQPKQPVNRPGQPAPRQPAPARQARPAPSPQRYTHVRFGNDSYYTHRGLFYRPGPGGYVVVRPPAGIIVPSLPIGFARIYFNNVLYFRFNDIYYRPTTGGYIVVQTPTVVVTPPPVTVVTAQPAVVATTTPAPAVAGPVAASDSDYQSFYVDGVQYHFKNGQFFKKSADGLIWVEPPMGAIIQKLPADATSVWYQDIEYFDCDSVYFRKTPDGYKVVDAPWTQQE